MLSIFHALSTGLTSLLLIHWLVATRAKGKVKDNQACCISIPICRYSRPTMKRK